MFNFFKARSTFWPGTNAGGSCGALVALVLTKNALFASMAHESTDRTSRRAKIPPPEESIKGAGRLRLVRSVHSCTMLATSVFSLKVKVLCPAAASGGFVRPKIWSRSEVGPKNQNVESSQNGLAYSGKS